MGNFLLDFRPPAERRVSEAARFLQFFPDMKVEIREEESWSAVTTSADDPELWGSFTSPDRSIWVALCGRVVLSATEWKGAKQIEGPGGLASKALYQKYLQEGTRGLETMGGHFVILLHDRTRKKVSLVSDRWGLVSIFQSKRQPVFASHPDALADAAGAADDLDLTSLAEFVLHGKVSAPFTYYQSIETLPSGSAVTISIEPGEAPRPAARQYFQPAFHPVSPDGVEQLADELADAFRGAVSERTLPMLGRSAVALSGGLDSRTILSAAEKKSELLTFCCFDQENKEFQIARSIAAEAGVEFLPVKRSADYYAETAEQGVKISAGMGCIASNHFLGVRELLRREGVRNLLTGCYCDYLFKGLALNKQVSSWTGNERLGGFSHSYYADHFSSATPLAQTATQRAEMLFPPARQTDLSEAGRSWVEQRRIFPLAYEADNAQRTIPLRTMGWSVPIADNRLLDVYCKIPAALKLNRTLFISAAEKVCGPRVSAIPDANTGGQMAASFVKEAILHHVNNGRKVLRRLKRAVNNDGSWPEWRRYLHASPGIRSLWNRPNAKATGVFRQILGDRFKAGLEEYQGKDVYLFLQLFTLKLWFDQRP